jgi:hypothetical protein
VLALLCLALFPGRGEADTLRYVLHNPAYVVNNACNGTVVFLHGDFVMTQVTTPTPDGGTKVRSRIVSVNLGGTDENGMSYRALDAEASFIHYLTDDSTSGFTDAHATLLLPQGNAPKMLLVTLFKETVAPDGTPSITLDRSYTVCVGGKSGSSPGM